MHNLDEAVIASRDDDILHDIVHHGQDLGARVSMPGVQQMGLIVGIEAHIPHTDRSIKACIARQCFSSATISVINTADSTVQHSLYTHAYCRAFACY